MEIKKKEIILCIKILDHFSNGLNSVLDLSNERNTKYTQRNLFTRKEWQQMKENFSPELKWKALEPDVTKELEQIEKGNAANSISK